MSLSAGKDASMKPIFFPLVLFNNDDNNLNSACSHCSNYLFNILVSNLLPRPLYCFSYIPTILNGSKRLFLISGSYIVANSVFHHIFSLSI